MTDSTTGSRKMSNITGDEIRKVLLKVIHENSQNSRGTFQSGTVLNDAASQLGIRGNDDLEMALLTLWSDLFRGGYIAWGHDLDNPKPPFYHITKQGRRTLEHLSRDPANPDGYLKHIADNIRLHPIAESYLKEALHSYNSACFKAAAVMVGGATERLILNIRDKLVDKITSLGCTPSSKLKGWQIKSVTDKIKNELDNKKKKMPVSLREAYEANWPAFIQQIRFGRNESGHPKSIDPIKAETVHASLLIFSELVFLTNQLMDWILKEYS